ncbi:MAG: hypothetical protein DHS20C08_24820 [Rhodomicrobium sp.]|nr:MAG: hypothetical protein DHS20C08_24820 [Rhodomicrobium sp.]
MSFISAEGVSNSVVGVKTLFKGARLSSARVNFKVNKAQKLLKAMDGYCFRGVGVAGSCLNH